MKRYEKIKAMSIKDMAIMLEDYRYTGYSIEFDFEDECSIDDHKTTPAEWWLSQEV